MRPPSFKLSDLDAHIGKPKLKRLFEALKKKYKKTGEVDPEGRAKIDVARLLTHAFEDFADSFAGVKKASLNRLIKLQKQALAFYKSAMAGNEPSAAKLQEILKQMDREFRAIKKSAQQHAAEPPDPTVVVKVDPHTGAKTVVADGGVAGGGGEFLVDADGLNVQGDVVMSGSHPGREKGKLKRKAGTRPKDQQGHGAGEAGVENPKLANMPENYDPEAAASNLGPKKRLDNLVRKTADAFHDEVVVQTTIRNRKPGDARPTSSTYEVRVGGILLWKGTIVNK